MKPAGSVNLNLIESHDAKYNEKSRDQAFLSDSIAWANNVCSSVAVVIANKELMRRHNFVFATSLSALHFITCAILIRLFSPSKTVQTIRTTGRFFLTSFFLWQQFCSLSLFPCRHFHLCNFSKCIDRELKCIFTS